MPVILSVETSTPVCSAAIHVDGILVAFNSFHVPNSTASRLAVLISQVLDLSGILPSELNAIAVTSGPGSYTGLRIGVATAKGMCYGLDIPLIAVNSLQLMASQVKDIDASEALLCPMIDARRMEVYTLLLDSHMQVLEKTAARIIDEASYALWLSDQEVIFFGSGSDKCRDLIHHANARFLSGVYPSAGKLGELATTRYDSKIFEDVNDFEPLYLKDFIAKKPKSVA